MGASLLALAKSIYWTLNFSSFKQWKGNNIYKLTRTDETYHVFVVLNMHTIWHYIM